MKVSKTEQPLNELASGVTRNWYWYCLKLAKKLIYDYTMCNLLSVMSIKNKHLFGESIKFETHFCCFNNQGKINDSETSNC